MAKQVKIRRGTAAQNAVFTGAQGEVVYLTDTKELVVHDGSTVAGFIGGGFMPAGAGAVATDVQSKLQERVSVLDFYANGVSGVPVDPTGVIDSTLGIQSAIDYVESLGGGTVFFPGGNYTASSFGANGSGVRLVGDGVEATTVTLKSGTNGTFVYFTGVDGGEIAHMTIDGNKAGNPSMIDKCALIFANSKNIFASDFHIKNCAGKGVAVASGTGGTVKYINISNFSVTSCDEQAVIVDATGGTASNVTVDNFNVYDVGHAGIAINDGATDVAVSNAVIDCNNAVWDAVAIRNAKRASITNVIGRRGRNGLYIQYDTAACEDVTVSNCIFMDNAQNGALILSAKRVLLSNVIARNNDQSAATSAGFNIAKSGAGPECSYISLSNCLADDSQGVPTQDYGYLIQNAPTKVLLSGCSANGSVIANTSIAATVATGDCLILPGHGVDMRDLIKWTTTVNHGNLVEFWRSGDTFARFAINQNGQLEWGTGSGARDVNLYRTGTNLLVTDDKLLCVGGFGIGQSASGISAQVATPSGNTSNKLAIYNSSNVLIGYIPIYTNPW